MRRIFGTVAVLHGLFPYFAHVFADPFRFFGIRTVVYPVEHAEVPVLPRGTVDDFAVCGDAAGHAAVPHLFVTVVEVGPGKFGRYAVRPQQRLARRFVLECFAFHTETYPIFAVGRSTLDVGFTGETGRCLRNEDIAGEVDGYLAAVRPVADEEQTLVGDGHGLGQVIERFGEGAEFIDFAGLQVHDGRGVLPGVVRCDGSGETAGILAAGRHGSPHLEGVQLAETGEFVVLGELVHAYLLRSLVGYDGDGGAAFGTGVVVIDGHGERPVVRALHLYPRCPGSGFPRGRGGFHLDDQRLIPFAQERARHLAQVDILEILATLRVAAGEYGCRTECEDTF